MANVGVISTAKGEQFTSAHVASFARADQGYFVISGCDCNQSGTPGMSVVVDSGYVQVAYSTERKTVTGGTLTVATADATYPRIDVIYVNTAGTISIYAGTPTAISPSSKTDFRQMATPAPGSSIPNGVILALVYVEANATTILNAAILDIASYGPYCVEAPTGTTTSGYVPQWSATAKTLGTGLAVGTSANNLIQLNASAQIPAVSAALVTGQTKQIITTIDGGGFAIGTGIKSIVPVDFNCTITKCTLIADTTGSCVVDIWKAAYANLPAADGNSITASATPTISSAIKYQNSTLTGWTTAITSGDSLYFNVDSCTTITRLTINLTVVTT